ncbi:hypothetical protein [Sinorhizobium sp. RAC02]|uniref:hypothetical protein n=1 Tax=Sinorhizobium sp. RAC02 TaxID=1842534 RepID=UPI00083CEFDF|nr:hypothetical protein [Sinorhizobium sp. RAC02]AOF91661.1 hypothetical protein BSY16_2272 [Sinorhizobium sp. RAC02]
MSRRKGELTSAGIDSGWPHQIARLASLGTMEQGDVIAKFCSSLSLCPRGHSVVWEAEWHRVYCFAKLEDAEAFLAHFGGEWFDPRDRGRGHKWHFWYKGRAKEKRNGRGR